MVQQANGPRDAEDGGGLPTPRSFLRPFTRRCAHIFPQQQRFTHSPLCLAQVPVKRFIKRVFRNVTTSEDPVLRRLAAAGAAQVFATDGILSALMCAPRSVYGWDIIVTRDGGCTYLDKRDRSSFDLLTVNETAQDPVPEEKESINGVEKLSQEATLINQNFSQQVLCGPEKRKEMAEPNPFAAGETDVAPVGYRYRKWRVDDDTVLIARCELHAVTEYKGEEQTCTVKSLNEFDSKVSGMDWRQKIETQRGAVCVAPRTLSSRARSPSCFCAPQPLLSTPAQRLLQVLATELKNNANKLAKWTCQALLAGADMMKIGYVTRAHPRDNSNHVVLATQTHKPKDFAAQINLSVANMWGIFKAVNDLTKKLPDGKYLLVKDPNKPLLRLYEIAADAFDNTYE